MSLPENKSQSRSRAQGILTILGLPFGFLTVFLVFLALAGLIMDITPVFRRVDTGLSRLLASGYLVINEQNLGLLSRIFVLLCCLPVHEAAHALTALLLGDDTGKRRGRISLNPARHLDLMGTVLILFIGMGYAKPVPVNTGRFRRKKLDFALTSLAGPLSNLLLCLLLLLLMRSVQWDGLANAQLLFSFFLQAAYINIALAIFNLLPIPPLDGSRVALAVFPENIYRVVLANERKVMGALFLFLYLSGMAGYNPISLLTGKVFGIVGQWIIR